MVIGHFPMTMCGEAQLLPDMTGRRAKARSCPLPLVQRHGFALTWGSKKNQRGFKRAGSGVKAGTARGPARRDNYQWAVGWGGGKNTKRGSLVEFHEHA